MRFKSLGAVIFAFAIAVPTCVSAQETVSTTDTLVLSLDQCIAIALDENPTIKVADMEIKRVDYSKKEIIGQLLPSISFDASYSRTIEKQVAYMNMDAFKGLASLGGGAGTGGEDASGEASAPSKSSSSDGGIKMGLDNSYTMGFSAALPIIAPQLWKSINLTDNQILQNVESARKSRLSLVNQIKNAYYTLLLAEDSYRVMQESYENAKFSQEVYEKRYKVGAASEYDVLRTSVTVKNIEPQVEQARISIKQAQLQLFILMGMDTAVPFATNAKLADYESTMYDNTLSLSRSISENSDLRMLDIQTETLKDALTVQKMAWFPTLALTANYTWTSSTNGTPFTNIRWNPYSTVGLAFSLPIFQGGQRYSRIKQASIQVEEMKWQRQNLERSLQMQVDVAIDNIQMNVKQIASNAESMTQADTAHQIMAKSFEIGAASYLDLRDSELALTRAQLAYYQAIYNYLVANSNLELLLGNADLQKYESDNE